MKKRNGIRAALCAVCIFLCCCLSGCSFSFCGLQAGGREELAFSCKEGLPDKSQEQTESLPAQSEEPKAEGASGEPKTEGPAEGASKEPKTEGPAAETAEEPKREEAGSREASDGGKVNLNTAGLEELTALNGIGEGRAKAILEYRDQNGPFAQIEDIMLVSGIKEGIFSKIKDQITVH